MQRRVYYVYAATVIMMSSRIARINVIFTFCTCMCICLCVCALRYVTLVSVRLCCRCTFLNGVRCACLSASLSVSLFFSLSLILPTYVCVFIYCLDQNKFLFCAARTCKQNKTGILNVLLFAADADVAVAVAVCFVWSN